ncbi:MAG: enoyl-CoA hydratase/isomerase family protein [Hyphomicrobiales bacterium]|nr:enoyl-CoA hydratase/isomerase family protein [Hyphomicrobiales bacterium]
MTQRYVTIKLEIADDGVGVLTLDRPEALNALNTQMMGELRDVFQDLYVHPERARCLVLTGAGNRGFCTGADLKERRGMSDDDWRRQHAVLEQMMRAMMESPVPVLAAVNGAAYAGGLEIALACDFIYAAEHARFALTEVTLGIMPGAMGTQNLPRAVGVRRAKEIILSGEPFGAGEALDWGLVNRVLPAAELLPAALDRARRIAANAPVSVRQAKRAIDKAMELDRASGYAFELEAYNRTIVTQDRREGIDAFNEKRKPVYRGR